MSSETVKSTLAKPAISAQQACLNSTGPCRALASWLDLPDLINTSNTCKAWQKAFGQEAIWAKRAKQLEVAVKQDQTAQKAVQSAIWWGKTIRDRFARRIKVVFRDAEPFDFSCRGTSSEYYRLTYTRSEGAPGPKDPDLFPNQFSGLFGCWPLPHALRRSRNDTVSLHVLTDGFNSHIAAVIGEKSGTYVTDVFSPQDLTKRDLAPAPFKKDEMEKMLKQLRECKFMQQILALPDAKSSADEKANLTKLQDLPTQNFDAYSEFRWRMEQLESGLGRHPEIDVAYRALCSAVRAKVQVATKESTDSKETKESKRSASSSTTTTS